MRISEDVVVFVSVYGVFQHYESSQPQQPLRAAAWEGLFGTELGFTFNSLRAVEKQASPLVARQRKISSIGGKAFHIFYVRSY